MNKLLILGQLLFCSSALAVAPQVSSLKAETPITLSGPAGKFDFMGADQAMSRILAAHRGSKTLEIIDLKSGKALKAIEVGAAQGVAVDSRNHKYFLGNEGDHSVAIVDSQSLQKTAEVKVDGPVDAIAFDDKNGMLFAAEDDGDHLWVIDTKSAKVVGTVSIPGVPEVLDFDPATNRIYLNIKDKNTVVRVDPSTDKVNATWSTLPATSPHGLVIDSKRGRVYSAGGNGKLVSIDFKSGKVISSADIPTGVDQIAFDTERQLIYSACKGFISITAVSDHGLKTVGQVASPKGAHTLAVDPSSHDVWVSYADEKQSYLQKFKASTSNE